MKDYGAVIVRVKQSCHIPASMKLQQYYFENLKSNMVSCLVLVLCNTAIHLSMCRMLVASTSSLEDSGHVICYSVLASKQVRHFEGLLMPAS